MSSLSARFDPGETTSYTNVLIDLSGTGGTVQKEGATWAFEGSIINSTDKNLGSITVMAMVLDAQNTLMAMEITTLYPSESVIAPGETNPYSISVYLSPTADITGYTTSVMVVGDVK